MSRETVQTAGRDLLLKWLAEKGRGSQAELAKRLGVTLQAVSQWQAGTTRPTGLYRDALEVATGIEPHHWETEKERGQRKRALTGPDPKDPTPGETTGKVA